MLDGENPRFVFEDGVTNGDLTNGIDRNEVRVSDVITNEEGRDNGIG